MNVSCLIKLYVLSFLTSTLISSTSFLKFMEVLNIKSEDPVPITLFYNLSITNLDFELMQLKSLPYALSISTNLTVTVCDPFSRNNSGILLLRHNDLIEATESLQEISNAKCDIPGNKIILMLEYPKINDDEIKSILTNTSVNFSFDSDVYIAIKSDDITSISDDEEFSFFEIYQTKLDSRVEKVVLSKRNSGIDTIANKFRRYNLRGEIFRPIIFTDRSYDYEYGVNVALKLTTDISLVLNFTFTTVEGTGWISIMPNGSLTGMGKQLDDSEGDFLPQLNELTLERQEKFEFILPIFYSRETAFLLYPQALYKNILFRPYLINVWIAFVLSFFVLVISIQVVMKVKKYDATIVGEPFLWVVGLFTQQGVEESQSSFGTSFKIVFLSGCILTTFVYNLYSASIITIISAREPPLQTFKQLVDTGVDILADKNARGTYTFVEKLFGKEKAKEKIIPAQEGMHKLMNSSSAFLSYRVNLLRAFSFENISIEDFCDSMYEVRLNAKGLPVYSGIYLKKHSPFRKMFLHSQIKMSAFGLIKRARIAYLKNASPNCLIKIGEIEDISLGVVYPAFVLPIPIICLSVIILILEIAHRNGRFGFRVSTSVSEPINYINLRFIK